MKEVGRNDPCPCGSGKKFKKCCGLKNPLQRRTFTQLEPQKMQSTVNRISGLLSQSMRNVDTQEEKTLIDKVQKNPPPKTEP